VRRESGFKAWLPVMYGCDNFCSYCVVPLVRGRERSRTPQAILEEARELIAAGYREITLLGQNVNSYQSEGWDFPHLLRELDRLEGDFLLRFMTSHPKDCGRELLDAMAGGTHIARHLHLPVQSGSDRILREMNRKYTSSQYLEVVRYARQTMPDLSLTGDVIVGFPGETYEEFRATLALAEQARYTSLFTFIFSPREGTRAASMPDPVSHEEKVRRLQALTALQEGIAAKRCAGMVGQAERVLCEDKGKRLALMGRTQGNQIIEFDGPEALIGQFVTVKITKASNWLLDGIINDNAECRNRRYTMQDIKQLTRSLGSALQLTPEYVRFVAAQEANDADEALGEQLRALELVRMQYRHEAAKEDAADAGLMGDYNEKFERLYGLIMGNPHMEEYREANDALSALLQWMTGLLQGCAQGEDAATFEPEQAGCGGNCGGCKGCG
jgi:cell fate (sporulation/competence/biofilm development) regulator YlbF (YheA/YmcA/DUF963 family)